MHGKLAYFAIFLYLCSENRRASDARFTATKPPLGTTMVSLMLLLCYSYATLIQLLFRMGGEGER